MKKKRNQGRKKAAPQFYVAQPGDTESTGPYMGAQIKEMWQKGNLTSASLIAQTGRDPLNWIEVSSVDWKSPVFGKRKPQWILLLLCVAGLSFAFFGRFHVVTSSDFVLPKIKSKSSFTLSETFVNIDKITGMPAIAAKAMYPLSVQMLKSEGWITEQNR